MMRLDGIKIKNYRQYRNFEIDFDKEHNKNDLHIIIGENDTGKTNLLNAINWCLYKDEPHMGKEKEEMPILNTNVINENLEEGGEYEVMVEMSASTDNEHTLQFKRIHTYKIHADDKTPILQDTDFKIFHTFPNGNTEIHPKESAQERVNKFVPKHLRKFFFFDGEEIKTYFARELASQIKQHVFDLSNIDLLERINDRLTRCSKDIRKEISKTNPKLERIEKKIDGMEKKIESSKKIRDNSKEQKEKAKEKYENLKKKLMGLPNPEEIQSKIDNLDKKRKNKKEKKYKLIEEKKEFLREYFTIFSITPAWKNVLDIIEEKREKKEFPPPYDPDELQKVIDEEHCRLCNRELDSKSLQNVKKLLESLEINSEINEELNDMEVEIKTNLRKVKEFETQLERSNSTIKDLEEDIEELNENIKDLEEKLAGHDDEQIAQWHKDMKKWNKIQKEESEKYHRAITEIENTKKAKKKKERELDEERKKEDKAKFLNSQKDFTEKANQEIKQMTKSIMDDTRKELEDLTKKHFFDLIWKEKSKTYKDIQIDENYNVSLIHSMGYSCYGTAGAAVRQFLALSFTLALHKISGFDTQLIIDTPVGRTSGSHRENLAITMGHVSENKQIILLFTPDEYDEKISAELDQIASTRVQLKMIEKENETKMEVLS